MLPFCFFLDPAPSSQREDRFQMGGSICSRSYKYLRLPISWCARDRFTPGDCSFHPKTKAFWLGQAQQPWSLTRNSFVEGSHSLYLPDGSASPDPPKLISHVLSGHGYGSSWGFCSTFPEKHNIYQILVCWPLSHFIQKSQQHSLWGSSRNFLSFLVKFTGA